MELFAPYETPTLESLFAFLELGQVAPLVPFEAMSEAPFGDRAGCSLWDSHLGANVHSPLTLFL